MVRGLWRQCNWSDPNRVLVFLDSAYPQRGEGVADARSATGDVRKSHVWALKMLAKQQTGGDSPRGQDLRRFCQEQSRMKLTNELRRFIEVDKNEAVKIGDLEKNSEAIKVVRSSSTWRFSSMRSPEKG